jgi:signal transduction histidine kinase/DNA-binding response OmpR family regulator
MASLRILIVDDHETVRRGIRALLSTRGDWSVCGEASDGREAVEKARELQPDIVLMDISMPRLDGLAATRILRKQAPQSTVIIVTQNDPGIARQQMEAVHARGFVAKTTLAQDLLPLIEDLSPNHGAAPAAPAPSEQDRIADHLFGGDGQMNKAMRSLDWSKTVLGEPKSWSPALRMMVRFLLANRFPQLLWWGPEFCCLYNDAYIPVLGEKHPWALGRPTAEVWSEIWHILKPLVETPFHGGPPTWMEDIPLEVNRKGFVEETHFTIAYSPVPDESVYGGIGGVIATVHEISEKVVGERRITVLRDLGARSAEPKTAEEACVIVAQILERHPTDIPFALLYLVDDNCRSASFSAGFGIDTSDRILQRSVSLDAADSPTTWPFTSAMNGNRIQVVQDLPAKFEKVPAGPWSDPPLSAAIVPIWSNLAHQLAGFLVAGISSRLQFDQNYRNFMELVSTQISHTIANACAYAAERKRAEALAEIDRAKTAFFSNVSHEFRTPLTLMLGPLQDLLSGSEEYLAPAARHQLELVNRNGSRLLRLVNTLLDFSRIEAGRVKAVYQATDLAAFTAELAGVFRSATDRAGLRLIVDCRATTEVAYVDHEMWEKIVLNLISNAFKFTFEGEIEVHLAQVGNAAELQIRDSGVGIPTEEIAHVFERFHRVPNTRSRTHEGSGIGLALVYELVKLHGGSMRVESTLGKGSKFFVTIPLGQDHLNPALIGGERVVASAATGANPFIEEALRWLPDLAAADIIELPGGPLSAPSDEPSKERLPNRPRVLIADDNADMRQYLLRLLSQRYDAVAVGDGQAALESARQRLPDLILSDIMMPNRDGFSLLREMRSNPTMNTIPVILLSARAGEEARVEGLDEGADDYLVKPFSARELLARVQTHLELARVRNEAGRRVRENEQRLRAFVNASSDVVYRMSPDWSEMRQLEGKDFIADTNDASGAWLSKYIYPDDQVLVLSAIREAIRTKSKFELEHRVLRRNGSVGWTFSRAIPLLDECGEIVEWFGTASDVTARKKVEEELREAQSNLELRVGERTQDLERMQEGLRDLSGKLVQLQDEERRRIARDLHDSAGQTLTVLAMSLAQLSQLTKQSDPQSAVKAAEAQELVQKLTREIRTTSYLLHPPLLDESGIAAALKWYVEGLAERSHLTITLDISEKFGRLPREMELAMFRIVQECLTNILRHSGSQDAEITVTRNRSTVALKIQDHGKGIPGAKLAALNDGGSGLGTRGMRDRVRQLNGRIQLESDRSGTTVSIELPISVENEMSEKKSLEALEATG